MEFNDVDNPFFRESMRPLKPTAQQLNDKRYKPTVEAIYLKRSEQPEYTPTRLPREGAVQIPIISGKPGDPNRHRPRPPKIDKKQDEFEELKEYDRQYEELKVRIAAIRQKSQMYPIWAKDNATMPNSISRKFGELGQQLFSLKKCFVSPEEIMLDNTAATIQRFWRSILRRQILKRAISSIRSYKHRELANTHRTLNSWVAQMEYANSRAAQFRFRGIAKVSKFASRFWQKWSEREAAITNRAEARALEYFSKLAERHQKYAIIQWRDLATGDRSRKAMEAWRMSMVPRMKAELEKAGKEPPQEYKALISMYIELRSTKSFMFNFFIAWHARYHAKSLRETVSDRNAFLLFKKHVTSKTFKVWIEEVRDLKKMLGTRENWTKYIELSRTQHNAAMTLIRTLVAQWHRYSHNRVVLRNKRSSMMNRLSRQTFRGWRNTVVRHRELKMHAILVWKRHIQDPKTAVIRAWNVYAIKRKTEREVKEELLESNRQWHNRVLIDTMFAKWQNRLAQQRNHQAATALEKRRWVLQATKTSTTILSGRYAKERERIADIEKELGDVTQAFVETEDEITHLEEITTTWKIALHAMKIEMMRLASVVQRCSSPTVRKRRRMSDEDVRDRISGDDRYRYGTTSKLSHLQISNRVIGKWERRNSDPDVNPELFVDLKPPLDDNIIQLISFDGE